VPEIYYEDDKVYQDWTRIHERDGYGIDCATPAVLHRAACDDIINPVGRIKWSVKVCSVNRGAIEEWGTENTLGLIHCHCLAISPPLIAREGMFNDAGFNDIGWRFLDWVGGHLRDGYFIDCASPASLHRAGCSVYRDPGQSSECSAKVCSTDQNAIVKWANANTPGFACCRCLHRDPSRTARALVFHEDSPELHEWLKHNLDGYVMACTSPAILHRAGCSDILKPAGRTDWNPKACSSDRIAIEGWGMIHKPGFGRCRRCLDTGRVLPTGAREEAPAPAAAIAESPAPTERLDFVDTRRAEPPPPSHPTPRGDLGEARLSTIGPGSRLKAGRFVLLNPLGRGGFGITYRAQDTHSDSPVAIKAYPLARETEFTPGDSATILRPRSDESKQFLDEARALARFENPGIVRVLDSFVEGACAFLVMELLVGDTLQQTVERQGPLAEAEAIRVVTEIGAAIRAVHAAGILHRDVKPSNVMLANDKRIVLIDFGSSRLFGKDMTGTLTALLTPGYAPVEQYEKHAPQGAYTDVYALTATLHFLLTAHAPITAMGRIAGLPFSFPDSITERTRSAMKSGLEIDPRARTQTIDDFLKSLQLFGGAPPAEKSSGAAASLATRRIPSEPLRSQNRLAGGASSPTVEAIEETAAAAASLAMPEIARKQLSARASQFAGGGPPSWRLSTLTWFGQGS